MGAGRSWQPVRRCHHDRQGARHHPQVHQKAKAPDDAQNKRIDAIEKRLAAVETVSTQHAAALRRDMTRFDGIDEEMRLVLVGVQNLLDAQPSGNNREGMQKSKSDINNYLLKGVTNHGSNP